MQGGQPNLRKRTRISVRLSTAISGFDYNDFASPSNGADLAFFDANERRLAYEIDEWRTNGESLVWVKLAELKRGHALHGGVGRRAHVWARTGPLRTGRARGVARLRGRVAYE